MHVARVLAWLLALSGAAGAGLLAALRSTNPAAPRLVELVALTPFGLALACLGVVSAGLLSLVARRRGATLLVVSLALTGLHTWWLAPLYVGEAPAADGARLVVMAQNFEYGDAQALVDLVAEAGADVLVITDVSAGGIGALRAAGIQRSLPHFSDQADGGSMVLSRFRVTAEEQVTGGGDSRLVTLQVPQVGELQVLALHPSPPYQDGQWSANWEAILDFVRADQRGMAGKHTVVAGDLNATRDHYPFRTLTALGFSGAVEQVNAGWLPTWPANGWQRRLGFEVPPWSRSTMCSPRPTSWSRT